MYNPIAFRHSELSSVLPLIRENPLATVITSSAAGAVSVSHLPLVAEIREGRFFLRGHLARANSHGRNLTEHPVTTIFHGPQGYISPSWYRSAENVPTWNYAVVHAQGRARLIEDFDGIELLLRELVDHSESAFATPWRYELPEEFRRELVRAIVGFEIEVHRFEGKFKLSQNRSPEDREGAIEGVRVHYARTNPALIRAMSTNRSEA